MKYYLNVFCLLLITLITACSNQKNTTLKSKIYDCRSQNVTNTDKLDKFGRSMHPKGYVYQGTLRINEDEMFFDGDDFINFGGDIIGKHLMLPWNKNLLRMYKEKEIQLSIIEVSKIIIKAEDEEIERISKRPLLQRIQLALGVEVIYQPKGVIFYDNWDQARNSQKYKFEDYFQLFARFDADINRFSIKDVWVKKGNPEPWYEGTFSCTPLN